MRFPSSRSRSLLHCFARHGFSATTHLVFSPLCNATGDPTCGDHISDIVDIASKKYILAVCRSMDHSHLRHKSPARISASRGLCQFSSVITRTSKQRKRVSAKAVWNRCGCWPRFQFHLSPRKVHEAPSLRNFARLQTSSNRTHRADQRTW